MARRGEGLRIQLSKIRGVTTGDAAKVLARPYRFQCPPLDSFEIPYDTSFPSYTNYKGTEFLGKGADQLQTITFRTLIVEYGRFVVEAHWDRDRPDRITDELVTELVNRLKRVRRAKVPFRLLATHSYSKTSELDISAVLESFRITEVAGEADTRYLDLSFRQWRDPVVQQRGRGEQAKTWPKYLILDKDKRVWALEGIVMPGRTASNLDGNDWTFAMLSKYAYGRPTLASHIMAAQSPPIRGWGAHSKIMSHKRYRKGGKIKIPAPPPAMKLNTGGTSNTLAAAPTAWTDIGMPGEPVG